jgi:hypothetical protein
MDNGMNTTKERVVLAAGAWLVVVPAAAGAQEASGEAPAAEPATGYSQQDLSNQGFRAADTTRPGDTVSGGALLVAAYGLIWTLAVVYIVWLTRRHTQNSQRIQDLARRLERLEAGGKS